MKLAKKIIAVAVGSCLLFSALVNAADPKETLTLGMTADLQG